MIGRVGWAVIAIVVVVLSASAGYLLGHGDAPSAREAREARIAARQIAFSSAQKRAYSKARRRGQSVGYRDGRRSGKEKGERAGRAAGEAAADAELAEIAEEEAAELEFVPQLPNGDPGYVLPEDERTLGCVGYSAIDGECVGD